MSKIGKNPVTVPNGVQVSIQDDVFKAKGKLGELSLNILKEIKVTIDGETIKVEPTSETRFARAMWATTRQNINNLVNGVNEGFTKELELKGVGYRAQMQGADLKLQLGLSHDVIFPIPQGIKVEVPSQTEIKISGADKQLVGQVAANIREFRKPEPYKGKGIRYKGERVIIKEGKKK